MVSLSSRSTVALSSVSKYGWFSASFACRSEGRGYDKGLGVGVSWHQVVRSVDGPDAHAVSAGVEHGIGCHEMLSACMVCSSKPKLERTEVYAVMAVAARG